jgi:hypothetical protein
MKTRIGIGALAGLLLAAGGLRAQEAPEVERVRPHLQVLQDPHDISLYYRAGGAGPSLSETLASRYPIASFYRLQRTPSPFGYSRFWTTGYEPRRSYAVGRNGDLFLFAPFLAPMGPLAGAFWEPR